MKKILVFTLFFLFSTTVYPKNDLYEKIDLFGEVLENIKKEYVDDVNQAEIMDSAINGVLQSLDPYSAYMSPELFKEMQSNAPFMKTLPVIFKNEVLIGGYNELYKSFQINE